MQRYNQVKAFTPEDFWYILLSLKRRIDREEKKVDFTWRREHLFEVDVVNEIYEDIMENPRARVTKVTQKNTKKWWVFHLHLRWFHLSSSQETTATDDRRASKGRITAPQAGTKESFGCMSIVNLFLLVSFKGSARSPKSYINKAFFHIPVQKRTNMIPNLTS